MRVLRSEKDSVMAMLEAFVYDPLINWRLLNNPDNLPDTVPHVPPATKYVPEDIYGW
jgi:FKBP12-rapamycin complex-associated protein